VTFVGQKCLQTYVYTLGNGIIFMNRVFSNGPSRDFVINPFKNMVLKSNRLWIAAPFVTMTQDLAEAAKAGKSVYLLVGLNASTTPESLSQVHGLPSCEVRYFTRRFHAKIYLFDREALVGSSNLTDGGLQSNREATICVDQADELDELRALFNELWESALVLTTEKLKSFTAKYNSIARPNLDAWIEDAVGKSEPVNINIGSWKKTSRGIFLEDVRRQVQQYRASFGEVTTFLKDNRFRRPELEEAGAAIETNRFLNWVRSTHVPEETWALVPIRSQDERRAELLRLGGEWVQADDNKIPEDYRDWLRIVRSTFATPDEIDEASKEQLTNGLLSVHAFYEQLRFTKGGKASLPTTFWIDNNEDVAKVKRTLTHLLHGDGDFAQRLHDVLYDPAMKVMHLGMFSALELYGTIKPEDCPPINGRMAKALRYIGFDVRAS
jgi:hypothetical protein